MVSLLLVLACTGPGDDSTPDETPPTSLECAADTVAVDGACIDTRSEPCMDAAPSDATSTVAEVTSTYTDLAGWVVPECAWVCHADFFQDGDACIDRRIEDCVDVAPARASSTVEAVTSTYSDAGGWVVPECSWACDADFFDEDGVCIDRRDEPCVDASPDHATPVVVEVTSTYTDATGWVVPECAWGCDGDFFEESDTCINTRMEPCLDVAPADATSVLVDAPSLYADATGWVRTDCAWACDADFVEDAGACINTRVQDCDDPNIVDAIVDVQPSTASYTDADGWRAPTCPWSCPEGLVASATGCEPPDLSQALCVADGCFEHPFPHGYGIKAAHMAEDGVVYAVAYPQRLLSYDGSWTLMDEGDLDGEPYRSVWAVDGDHIWVGGEGAELRTWDGAGWTLQALESDPGLDAFEGLWGFGGGSSVYAVADGYYASSRRSIVFEQASPEWLSTGYNSPHSSLNDLHGIPSGDLFAVGDNELWHYDGADWDLLGLTPSSFSGWVRTNAVWAFGTEDVFTGGYRRLHHYTSSGFGAEAWDFGVGEVEDLYGYDGEVWAAVSGTDAGILHYDGVQWSQVMSGTAEVEAIVGAEDTVYAFGRGFVAEYDGEIWRTLSGAQPETSWYHYADLNGVPYLFGSGDGSGVVGYWDVDRWRFELPGYYVGQSVVDSAGVVYSASEDGLAVRAADGTWSHTLFSGWYFAESLHLNADDDIWAGASGGQMQHFDGTRWQEIASPTSDRIDALWGTPGGSLYIGDDEGGLWSGAAGAFTPVSAGITDAIKDIEGRGADDVWVLTSSALFHFDGASWTQETLPHDGATSLSLEAGDAMHVVTADRLLSRDGGAWSEAVLPNWGNVTFERDGDRMVAGAGGIYRID